MMVFAELTCRYNHSIKDSLLQGKETVMKTFYEKPQLSQVTLQDEFWTPYVEGIRDIMIPYCFDKFEETGYVQNFRSVANGDGAKHQGPPFSDGLLLETITGASNFLAMKNQEASRRKIEALMDVILSAQQEDGYLHTIVTQDYPQRKWGEGKDGDIIVQHDLYNQGALIEAATAYYKATKNTTFLKAAVKCANNICSYIGEKPKHNVIPGHSLPEMAFIELYRLFRDDESLADFARENDVRKEAYLEVVRFWYDHRGHHEGRNLAKNEKFTPEYNQDSMPFAKMRKAMGHAVRAGLCYQGAAAARRELQRDDYEEALLAIWEDVITKKLHISGGVGARHDIEGFDSEYQLPNGAYLETCAGIALAFWAAEMNLLEKRSAYFDYFELSLYNNILGAVGEDFLHYYYDNPLVNDGTKNRWDWHGCPCCPPMLAKIYSSLPSFIYSYHAREICVNLYMGSTFRAEDFEISQSGKRFRFALKEEKKVCFRIPQYAKDFQLLQSGNALPFETENGYAAVQLPAGETEITVSFDWKLAEICMNPKAEDNRGRVCVMYGPYLMCAEGIDNGLDVSFTVSEDPRYAVQGDTITLRTAAGTQAVLIPYYRRNNRVSGDVKASAMAVWFNKENMKNVKEIEDITGGHLYGYYGIY